jgi:hypothetical protein
MHYVSAERQSPVDGRPVSPTEKRRDPNARASAAVKAPEEAGCTGSVTGNARGQMVGDAWGLLSMEEKEAYKAKAQLQARERRNTLSAAEERALPSHETGRQQRAPTQKQLQKSSLMTSGPTPPPFAHDDISDGGAHLAWVVLEKG